MERLLTRQEALDVMIEFVDQFYYKVTNSNDIGSLLGDISQSILWEGTGDPAASSDWDKAINDILHYSKEPTIDNKITIKTAFLAMREFLYSVYGRFDDVIVILYDTRFDSNNNLVNKEVWNNYLQAVNTVLSDTERYK